jgi:hypothetical protein
MLVHVEVLVTCVTCLVATVTLDDLAKHCVTNQSNRSSQLRLDTCSQSLAAELQKVFFANRVTLCITIT